MMFQGVLEVEELGEFIGEKHKTQISELPRKITVRLPAIFRRLWKYQAALAPRDLTITFCPVGIKKGFILCHVRCFFNYFTLPL